MPSPPSTGETADRGPAEVGESIEDVDGGRRVFREGGAVALAGFGEADESLLFEEPLAGPVRLEG